MSTKEAPFTSFAEAQAYMGNKEDRPAVWKHGFPRSTRVVKTPNGVGIKYHNTVVVEYTESGIVLNTGGWYTLTTKARINDCLQAIPNTSQIHQEKRIWYYGSGLFYDGMIIGYDGWVENPPNIAEQQEALAEKKRLQKLVKKYRDTLRKMLENDSLEEPSSGDCWVCCGKFPGDNSHLIMHLEETYIVPSLIWEIVNTRGSIAMREHLLHVWTDSDRTRFYRDHTVRTLPHMVSQYFREKLNL